MIMEITDEKLVARTLAGDRNAFRSLVERHYRLVYRLSRNILRHPEEAEDCTQEVFVRAYQALGQFEGRGVFAAWLRRLTVNYALNRAQSAANRYAAQSHSLDLISGTLPASAITGPEASFWRAHEREKLQTQLDALPPQQRTALGLRLVDGLSYDEIAELMGAPVNSVRSWLHRGRATMRAALEEMVEC